MISGAGFEIEFFPVGEGKRSGDAISVRFGSPGNYKVLVYDGGTKQSGQAIVDHVRKQYGVKRVDYLVNSHPDGDHASGLALVLEQLEVGELWLHRPWAYCAEIREYFHDGRMTDVSLARRFQEKMSAAHALEVLAMQKGVPVYEPFAGQMIAGVFKVLSPQKDWYVHELIQEFAKTPAQKKTTAANEAFSIADTLKSALAKLVEWIDETWAGESLRSDVCTSAENESSVILFGQFGESGVLLTGDAGVRALTAAADYAENVGLNLPRLVTFAQVPHHGSRNNVTSAALDRLFGPAQASQSDEPYRTAYVSASKESETHPRPAVVNAFMRRGFKVFRTKGKMIRHHYNMPGRDGWGAPERLQFFTKVQAWD
jgi:beta-lactamase superfamily II metal-dependent hydrolase